MKKLKSLNIIKQELEEFYGKDKLETLIDLYRKEAAYIISEDAVLYKLAKDIGIEIKEEVPELNLEEINETEIRGDIKAKITRIYPARKIKKEDKVYRVMDIELTKEDQKIELTLWNREINEFEKENIEEGDMIELEDCLFKKEENIIKVRLGATGIIKLKEKGENNNKFYRVVSNEGIRKGENYKMAVLTAISENGDLKRIVIWNDEVDKIYKIKTDDIIKIEGGEEKEDEIHLTWGNGRIITNIINAPNIEELFKKVKLNEIKDGLIDHFIEIEGIIYQINMWKKDKTVIRMEITDNHGKISIVIFENKIKDVLNVLKTEIENVIELKKRELLLKYVRVRGRLRKNKFEEYEILPSFLEIQDDRKYLLNLKNLKDNEVEEYGH